MKYIIDFNNREDSDFLRTVRVLTELEVDFNIIDFWNVHSCEKEYHIAIPFLEYVTRLRDINKDLNFDSVCISSKIFFELQLQYLPAFSYKIKPIRDYIFCPNDDSIMIDLHGEGDYGIRYSTKSRKFIIISRPRVDKFLLEEFDITC